MYDVVCAYHSSQAGLLVNDFVDYFEHYLRTIHRWRMAGVYADSINGGTKDFRKLESNTVEVSDWFTSGIEWVTPSLKMTDVSSRFHHFGESL